MSDRNLLDRTYRPCAVALALLLGLLSWLGTSSPAGADDRKASAAEQQTVVGKVPLLSLPLVHREGPDKGWHLIRPNGVIYKDDLIVALPLGAIESNNGAVRLTLLSDLARQSPYPVLESAVLVHENAKADLDFTLDRGRVDVSVPRRHQGPAHVIVRFRKEKWELTLDGPDTRVALELYGRWPRGVPFQKLKATDDKNAEPQDEPTSDLVLLVIKGNVELNTGKGEHALTAPPGPAFYHWDSVAGADGEPKKLEKLPKWAKVLGGPIRLDLPDLRSVAASFLQLKGKGVDEALVDMVDSPNTNVRKIAVYGLGALDDLPHLLDALTDPKHDEVRDVAVMALRAWIGRDAKQDMKVYNVLVKEKKHTENQAEIVLQLLHSFSSIARGQPATYETLIDYLLHEKPAIRQLAIWHLHRLAPAGEEIPYDPTASEEKRQKAYDEWKKLIPSGQLPPKPKSPDEPAAEKSAAKDK